MDAKSPVTPSVVMLVVAVFVIGGLVGYLAGSTQAERLAGVAPAPAAAPPGGTCPLSAQNGADKPGAACPMTAETKRKATAGCPRGDAKGECQAHENCPEAGNCPQAKAAVNKPHGACALQSEKSAAKAAAPAAKATYGCSMCPQVKSDKPGKCPHCGMALSKKQ